MLILEKLLRQNLISLNMNEEKSSYLNLPHRVYEVTVKENFLNNKISCLIYLKPI